MPRDNPSQGVGSTFHNGGPSIQVSGKRLLSRFSLSLSLYLPLFPLPPRPPGTHHGSYAGAAKGARPRVALQSGATEGGPE